MYSLDFLFVLEGRYKVPMGYEPKRNVNALSLSCLLGGFRSVFLVRAFTVGIEKRYSSLRRLQSILPDPIYVT